MEIMHKINLLFNKKGSEKIYLPVKETINATAKEIDFESNSKNIEEITEPDVKVDSDNSKNNKIIKTSS